MTASEQSYAAATRPAGRTSTSAESLFLLLIVVMPLAASPLMAARIFDVGGFKPANIVAIAAFLAFLAGGKRWRPADRLEREALLAFCAYLIVLTLAFIRSFPNIARFHQLFPDTFPPGAQEYIQSYFVLPVLFALSFLYVLKYMCSRQGLLYTISAISIAMCVLSSTIIVVFLRHPAVIMDMDPSRSSVNHLALDSLGMGYNGLGAIYIITGPLLLYMALTRGPAWALNFWLALIAVLLLKSRTAIFTFLGMNVVTLLVLGRVRILVSLAPFVIAIALAVLGRVLVHLLSTGVTRSGISTFVLFSGREQAIWLPLLGEWVSQQNRVLWGEGLFGVMTSNVLYSARSIFGAGEAHNFYLEFFLDNGIFGFLLFAVAIIKWLIWGRRVGREARSPVYWVLFLCVISFLISGVTGRRYFPEAENALMFPIMALLVNVARLKLCTTGHRPPRTECALPASQAATKA